MGPQDGIDHAVRALGSLAARDDWHAIFIGEGDVLEDMRALAAELGLGDRVEFAGWRYDDDIRRILSSADVCLAPDPPSPLNDVSTMIKIPEYMAMGKPVVSYELAESVVSAGDAAAYAEGDDPEALGRCLGELLDDPERRSRMGALGQSASRASSAGSTPSARCSPHTTARSAWVRFLPHAGSNMRRPGPAGGMKPPIRPVEDHLPPDRPGATLNAMDGSPRRWPK